MRYNLKVFFLSLILKLTYGSNRKIISGKHNYLRLIKKEKPMIFAVWHGHLLSIVHDLRNLKIKALAGMHSDAELISNIAKYRGWSMIRGSSKNKGTEAYKRMITILKTEKNPMIFITPDGPSGPPKIPKLGVIRLAKQSGAAIIPITVKYSNSWGFKNWDTFYLTKPFGKIIIKYGRPIYFNKNNTDNSCSEILIKNLSDE